ncbi:MAG TPA: T9SS type A sorting domain-containing protein, partial [Bacteroidetes bacterium]|nr:T9SS type A sorting domain-containing protein [Bacteroidota bacterium]
QYFQVVDKKAPTPVMVDIATALMTNCMVELCAKQFDKGGCDGNCISSYDNCTYSSDLYFTFSNVLPQLDVNPAKWQHQFNKYGRYFYDPVSGQISTEEKYLFGEAYAWDPENRTSCRVFGIDREGNGPDLTNAVEVYVWDQFAMNDDCDDNNYDFAVVILTLNNEGDDCPVVGSLVNGMISNCSTSESVDDVKVRFDNGEQNIDVLNNADGSYNANLADDSYSVTASKQEDGLYGLTTLDLVIIQKHILGIKKTDDICKYASMDVNGDGRVSAADILVARKMILGSLPAVTNWNFLDEQYVNDNPNISHFDLTDAYTKDISVTNGITQDNTDFTGVRRGDVNFSALGMESRNGETSYISIDDQNIEKGMKVEVPVYANQLKKLVGLQFSMDIAGMELKEIKSGLVNISEDNYNVVDNNLVVSWNTSAEITSENDALFTLVFKSGINGKLSDVLSINDNVIHSEIYSTDELLISDLKLEYRNSGVYTLYQNEPNPFSETTTIGFNLPEDNSYTITIFDLTGKVLKEYNTDGKAGYNSIKVSKKDIGMSGVYYYRLNSGDFTSTKKMVILK